MQKKYKEGESPIEANRSVTFFSDKTQWLNPVQLGISTILRQSAQPATIEAVLTILTKLEADEVIDFVKAYYRAGIERFGDSWGHTDLLTVLVATTKLLQPQSYLEIGVFHGRSMSIVGSLAPDCHFYGFDLWIENYAGLGNAGPDLIINQLQRVGHRGKTELISGDSKVMIPQFLQERPELFFDLINVDGDHGETGARLDLQNVLPRLKIGGVLVFDDICHPQHPWLERVWDEVIGTNPNFLSAKYTETGHGIAIAIRRGTDITADVIHGDALERLKQLSVLLKESQVNCQLNEADRVAKEEVITRLSDELEMERTNRLTKEEVITRLSDELEAIRTDRLAKEEVIAQVSGELEMVRADQAVKEGVIARLGGELEMVRADQAAKEEVITRLKEMVAAKEAVITRLGSELAEYQVLGWGLVRSLKVRADRFRQRGSQTPEKPATAILESPSRRADKARATNVALDVMQIQFGVSGGVEVYMKTLVRALLHETAGKVHLTLLCHSDQLAPLQALFGDEVAYYTSTVPATASLGAAMRSTVLRGKDNDAPGPHAHISFARLGEDRGIQLLHSPVQIFSQTDFTVPAVLNLHDLQHLHYPENFTPGDLEARHRLYSQSAELASAIIASSDFVRQDIIERMGVPASKVHTIPVACNPEVIEGLQKFSPEQAKQTYHLPETFAFYPAQFWPHKNHARLIEALAIVRARSPQHNLKLVLSGYRFLSGWPLVEQALEAHNLQDHVLFLDFVPSEHLGAIYRLAMFCIMPSLFEASSYPVIEAQMLGCPAMCSNITSLPELVVDGAGLLFDPLSPEDMADKMLRWLNDPDDRRLYAERGQRRARRNHSLEEYASRVMDVYSKVLELYTMSER